MPSSECFAEVKKSGIDGRGLFATKSIKAGELVFKKARPLVTALDFTRQDDTCADCFRSKQSEVFVHDNGSEMDSFEAKKCTGCHFVAYCSKNCQSQHWKRSHKVVCKVLKDALSNVPNLKENPHHISNVIFALVEMIRSRDKLILAESDWISVLQLKSHTKEMQSTDSQRYLEAQAIAETALMHLGIPDYSQDFVTQLACAVLTNSLTLVAPTCDPLGLVFDPFVCLANHSCDPNAYVVMNGPELSFRALKDIAKGDEVLVSYIDNTEPRRFRLAQLKKRYYFECRCSKCEIGVILDQDKFLTPSTPQQRQFRDAVEKMRKQDPKTIELMRQRFGLEGGQMSYSDLIDCYARNDLMCAEEVQLPDVRRSAAHAQHPVTRLYLLEAVLKQCHMSGQYAPTRQPYAAARNEYILECIAQADLETAWLHALKSYIDIDPVLYQEPHNPLRVVHTHRLAKLTIFLSSEAEGSSQGLRDKCIEAGLDMPMLAWRCMREAASQVDKSHGSNSPFSHLVKSTFKSAIDSAGPMVSQIEGSMANLEPGIKTLLNSIPY